MMWKRISKLQEFLSLGFHTKDLGVLKYFLGIDVARSKHGINLYQRKYVTNLLSETGLLSAKQVDTLMDPNCKISASDGLLLENLGQ